MDWIYNPSQNGKTSQNEIESSQNALYHKQRSFCCDVAMDFTWLVSARLKLGSVLHQEAKAAHSEMATVKLGSAADAQTI